MVLAGHSLLWCCDCAAPTIVTVNWYSDVFDSGEYEACADGSGHR